MMTDIKQTKKRPEIKKIGGKLSGSNASAGLADITGTFSVSKGIAQSSDLLLASSMGNGQAQGKVDLSRWLINVAGQFELSPKFLGKILGNGVSISSKLPFFIRGNLNSPNVKFDTSGLISRELIKKGLDSILKKKGVGGLLQNILPGLGAPNQKSRLPTQAPNEQGRNPPSSQNNRQAPKNEVLKNLLDGLGR